MPIIRRQTPTSSTDTLAATAQDRTVVTATGSAAAIAAISATYPATANNGNTLIIAATDRDYVVSSNGAIWAIEADPTTGGQRRYVVNNEGVIARTFASWSTEDNRWHSDAFTANEVPDSQEDKLAMLLPEIPSGYDPALVGGYLAGTQVFQGGTLYTANKASLDPPGPFVAADWDTFVTEDDGKEITQQLDGATLGYASIGYLSAGGTYTLTTNINTAKKVDAIIPPNSVVTVDGTTYTNASLTESQGLNLYNDGTGWVRESAGQVAPSSITPDNQLIRSSFKMAPGAADVAPSDTTWAPSNTYTKELNLTPGAKVVITIHPLGYSSSAPVGYVVGALNSADNVLSGGDRTIAADDAAAETLADTEAWAVWMKSTVLSGARHSYQAVVIPEFTVPSDGIVKIAFSPYGSFRSNINGSGLMGYVEQSQGYSVAAIDRLQEPRALTLAGSTIHASSPDRVSDTENTIFDGVVNSIRVAVPAGQKIASVATVPANLATLGGLDIVNQYQVVNVVTENPVSPATDVSLTVTLGAITGIRDITVFNFQTGNGVLGPSIANGDAVDDIAGWQFNARSDIRQIRMTNVSGRKRVIQTSPVARESVGGGDALNTGTWGMETIAYDAGDTRQITGIDFQFNTGGGAAAGDVEYAMLKVYEFDPTDRLEINLIHELWISMAVGNGWVGNDWRVKLVTWGN